MDDFEKRAREVARLDQIEARDELIKHQRTYIDELKAELAAAKRDNATLNLANHLPPRPRCPDCGIESLYGSVHTDECIKTSELREELERAKAENEKLHAILSELIEMYDIGFPMGDSKVYFNKARAALEGEK